jgi:hypothetical protein
MEPDPLCLGHLGERRAQRQPAKTEERTLSLTISSTRQARDRILS